MNSPALRKPIYGIDLVRFLAAMAVVLYHFSAKPFLSDDRSTVGELVRRSYQGPGPEGAVWWGWIGVQVFFVVSGAVIAFSVAHAGVAGGGTGAAGGQADWRRFVVGRLSRLWPAMLICTAVIAVLNLGWWGHGPLDEAKRVVGSLAFLPWGPWVSGQFWTLPIEVVFYAMVALMIALGGGHRLEALAWVLGCGSALFWMAVQARLVHPGAFALWFLVWHGVYFALGVVIMAVGTRGASASRVALALICCLGAWFEVGAANLKELGPLAVRGAYGAHVPYAIWLAVAAFIFWATLRRDAVAARIEAISGAARALRAMGLATYPLYMIHVQPGALVMAGALGLGASPWLAVVLSCLAALALALLVALVLEPPLTRRVRGWLAALLIPAARHAQRRATPAAGFDFEGRIG